jgi:UDP-4-keto-D-QuiNAc 4-reductase
VGAGKRVLVTGASGFIGTSLCSNLAMSGFRVRGVSRSSSNLNIIYKDMISVGEIDGLTSWDQALCDVDTIVHLAGRAHILKESIDCPLDEYIRINVKGAKNLALSAVQHGVRRLVFISSIGVNGNFTSNESRFFSSDVPNPHNDYSLSKFMAETELFSVAKNTNLEIVIIRPPLVYGPNVKANFGNMMTLLFKEIPLPFGSIKNKRSLVSIDNLVDLIITCIVHPNAENEVFLVSDGEDVSTPDLLNRLIGFLGKKSFVFPFNTYILKICLIALGKKSLFHQLCSCLQVDINETKKKLDWSPVVSIDESLKMTAKAFLNSKDL